MPHPLQVIEILPGFTIGGLYAARYGDGKDAVSEFGVLQSYVHYGDKRGFFIRHYCMEGKSSPEGCAGNSFKWERAGNSWTVKISTGGSELIDLRVHPVLKGIPFNGTIPFLCVKGNSVAFLQNHFISRIGISTSTVRIPPDSPIHGFPLKYKILSTFWDTSNIIFKEPEYVTTRAIKRADNVLGTPIGKST
ncbi:MAG: hypothetical protein ABSG42_02385 [Nitrospirota bacterium]